MKTLQLPIRAPVADPAIKPTIANAPAHDATAQLRVLIVYDEAAAGRQALGTLTRLLAVDAEPMHLLPALWRFELLDDPHGCQQALADAAGADLLILATHKPDAIPEAVEKWVSAFLAQRRESSTAILALFGAEDDWSISVQDKVSAALDVPFAMRGRPLRTRRIAGVVAA